jgi:formylglycine-generating enzyme required for sulfatase activity
LLIVVALLAYSHFFKGVGKAVEKEGERYASKIFEGDRFSRAANDYLEKFIADNRHFRFRGLDTRARGIEPPELDHAYISIRMTPEAEDGETQGRRAGREAEGTKGKGALELLEGRLGPFDKGEPLDLAGAIQRSSRLAIVGVAGSGKSTLLQWAGLACARSRLRQQLSPEQREFVNATGGALIPVLVPLRAFNRHCEGQRRDRTARALLDFIAVHVAEQHPSLDLPSDFFKEALSRGCLLMLDGVDEVDPDERGRVREAIEGVVQEFGGQDRSRYLVTSRTVAYFGAARVTGFHKCTVQPLTPDQRDTLIRSWCNAVYGGDEARRQSDDLCSRIAASDERVRGLAVTPLMVTIFALVHYDRRELPRQRAELYEHAVRILLTEPYKTGEAAAGLKEWAGLDWQTRRNRLMLIAFELHRLGERGDAVPEDDLVGLIWRAFGAEEGAAPEAARRFVRLVADRGGLLEEADGRYGFYTHRTFREFLAGRYLAEELAPTEQRVFMADHLGDDHWVEPARLAAGYLAIHGEHRPNAFIGLLADLGSSNAERARALTLAGLSLSDLPSKTVLPKTREIVVESQRNLLTADPPRVESHLRRALGVALGAVGDPRLKPGGIPPLVPVPAGLFRMGTSPEEAERLKAQDAEPWNDEFPQHPVFVSEFEIGKHLVTNAEFLEFWKAGGYDTVGYWSQDGWRWRRGELETDLLFLSDEELRRRYREWLEGRPVGKRDQPFFWDDPERNAPNLPVVGVTWYEAEAYCNWLSEITGQKFRLPTEAEWEKAARWDQGRLWPWGDEWDPDKCNSADGKLGGATPVGMYPSGASPYGVLDMVGNVWEWCADWWDGDAYKKRQGQDVRDPTGTPSSPARVMRGGAWDLNRGYCRAAARSGAGPVDFDDGLGFRVVRAPVRF